MVPGLVEALAEAVCAAQYRLQSFLVQVFHLKDALVREAGSTRVTKEVAGAAINQDPHPALLADLANLD